MRIMQRILFDRIPIVCRPFLDDVAFRGPTDIDLPAKDFKKLKRNAKQYFVAKGSLVAEAH